MKVFISRPIPKLYQTLINNFEVDIYEKDEVCPRSVLLERIKGVDAAIVQWEDYVDAEFFDAAGKNLKVVAYFATGTDRLDVAEANKRGIIVTNTDTQSLFAATAEAAVALLTTVARRTAKLYVQNVQGDMPEYSPIGDMGVAIRGKVTGIVGMGNIGSKVAEIMHKGFGNNIIYFNRSNNTAVEKAIKAEKVELSEIFSQADFVFLTIPQNKGTEGMITKELLTKMSSNSILVSISPAEILDNNTLVELIQRRKIYGAGLDIYPNDLKALPNHNLILTAHSANAERETTNIMTELCVSNVMNVLTGKEPITPVKQ